ncbi:hypothetical protein BDF22DRAFT_685873 [Syncephalis plumigaleata]|nr:hypothetical protein BDF22DRAFT_685873 [Syncephalis plumigaleata]
MPAIKQLLLVFVHGFRGDDTTFEGFPERLRQVLTNSLSGIDVDTAVYPQYQTRGDFTQAVSLFCQWLIDQTSERQRTTKDPVHVILLGHSMGGLVATDAIDYFRTEAMAVCPLPDTLPIIIGLLAYDTPFFGLSAPFISRAAYSHVNTWSDTVSSTAALLSSAALPAAKILAGNRWKAAASGGILAAALVGTAFANRDKVREGVRWASEHLVFASTLMGDVALRQRMERLCSYPDLPFRCYYNVIRSSSGDASTFIHTPPSSVPSGRFIPIPSPSKDEIDAHTTMFSVNNPTYYTIGDNTINFICDTVNTYKQSIANDTS